MEDASQVDVTKGIKIQLKFVPGKKLLYQLDTQIDQQISRGEEILNENESGFQSQLLQKILATEKDGSGHIVTIITPPDPDPDQGRQVVYQHTDATGAILEISGMSPSNSFALPDGVVKKDEAWFGEVAIPLPQNPEPILCTTEYVVTGTESFAGLDCVSIECTAEEFEFQMPNNQGTTPVTMSSNGTMLFAPKEGLLARLELETITSVFADGVYFTTTALLTQEFQGFQ